MNKIKTLQDIITDFVKNIDLVSRDQLEAIGHLIEIELLEREEAANPQNWGDEQ